ncbi:hypothetical protein [Streptomyces griseoaurantiacus]|uniref:hypothetical protein n=1 Tax=Streptomyces griseoaurantiacus TaxID=68213 RepID=UPI0030DE7565
MSHALSLHLLALVCLVGDVLLVMTGHDVPPLLETISTVTVSAVAGAALPRAKEPA